jgi:hypothetical protein
MFGLSVIGLVAASSAVFFSPSTKLGSGYRELPMPVDKLTLKATVDSLLGRSATGASLVDATAPHVVLFEAPGTTEDLKALVQASGSSVGLPYATDEPVDVDDAKIVGTADELADAIKGGLPKLLVVRAPEAFSFVSKLNAVSTDYVALAITTAQGRALESKGDAKSVKIEKVEGPELQIMATPVILTGLLVSALWLTIFFSGVCCLFTLSTPDKFEEKCIALNKEY